MISSESSVTTVMIIMSIQWINSMYVGSILCPVFHYINHD